MTMRFYDRQQRFYADIDLHSRTMHLCVLDANGNVVFDRNLPPPADPMLSFLAALASPPSAGFSESSTNVSERLH
jgi:hypothetical protein